MYKRNVRFKLQKALDRSPVTLLLGARQVGKTTLMREIAKDKGYHYISFDDIRFLSTAQADPMGFIQDIPKPVILDEIQRVPELFLAIKHDVDQNRIPGRYALTGSANPLLIPRLGDSLAGRMEILTLYPLSQGELIDRFETFIDTVWTDDNLLSRSCIPFTRQELYTKMLIGGYPVVQDMNTNDRHSWFNNYISTIVQKDMLDIAAIDRLAAMPRLLSLLAMHAGSLLNVSELSRKSGIANTTLNRYLILLKTIFLLFLQESWHSNLIKRIVKSPKPYLVDSGLLSWLLLMTIEKMQTAPGSIGHILENFVVTELKKQATWNETPVNAYHFRSLSGHEVDIVLERLDGKIIGIEIKTSATPTPKDARGLMYLKDHVKDAWHRGIILYTGDQSIPFGSGIVALPISSLWSF